MEQQVCLSILQVVPDGTNDAQNGSTGVIDFFENVPQGEINSLVNAPPVANFTTMISQDLVEFSNLSIGGQNYFWSFGDDSTSMEMNPSHIYLESGIYTVQLIVENDCGSDTAFVEIEIVLLEAPSALFSLDANIGCPPLEIQFSDQSTGQVENRNWTFPGGNPGTSMDPNPLVIYEIPGIYNVQLEVSNSAGSSTLIFEDTIEVVAEPVPSFDISGDNGNLIFNNTSTNATSYLWDFGDGSPTSSEVNPLHTYTVSGVYEVTLIAANAFCTESVTIPINVMITGLENHPLQEFAKIYPNPTNDILNISIENNTDEKFQGKEVIIYQMNGKEVFSKVYRGSLPIQIDMKQFESGFYLLTIKTEGTIGYWKIGKIN